MQLGARTGHVAAAARARQRERRPALQNTQARLLSPHTRRDGAALPAAVELHYAMKANPMPAVVGFMAGLVNGTDVASAGELKVALDAGAHPAGVAGGMAHATCPCGAFGDGARAASGMPLRAAAQPRALSPGGSTRAGEGYD